MKKRGIAVSRGAWLTLGAALAVAVLALSPGTFGSALAQTAGDEPPPTSTGAPPLAPPPTAPPPVVQSIAPTDTVVLESPGASLTLDIAPSTFTDTVIVNVEPIVNASSNPNTSAFQNAITDAFQDRGVPSPVDTGSPGGDDGGLVVNVFEMSATSQGTVANVLGRNNARTSAFAEAQPTKPITIGMTISPEVLAAAGGDSRRISLRFFDEASRIWTPVPQTGGLVGGKINFAIPHFSLWALIVLPTAPAQATPAATSTPAGTGTPGGTPAATVTAPAATATAPAAGGVAPRPANTGTGLPGQTSSANMLGIVVAMMLLGGAAGSATLLVLRRR